LLFTWNVSLAFPSTGTEHEFLLEGEPTKKSVDSTFAVERRIHRGWRIEEVRIRSVLRSGSLKCISYLLKESVRVRLTTFSNTSIRARSVSRLYFLFRGKVT
jgi:hypothetical protein